ncbi:vacuole effluxer Atg22 like-domain-containing protein [Aspergillus undulatus]|uniref:vacuole effluxer Atg22 like-domain-containing protein n=1 Tax=Aspergillus undulatus TaxID=1810928 RepID=UPI003CCD830B
MATNASHEDEKPQGPTVQAVGVVEADIEAYGEQPTAPDQFDDNYRTTRLGIWAYYAYYIGNNGLSLFNFAPTAFQNLLAQAAGDEGVLLFAGQLRSVESIVLLCNGIPFAIQVVVFLVIGSFADWAIHGRIVAYQTTLTFWAAAFPGLARNTTEMKTKADEYQAGSITREEYDFADTMKRSQLANIAFYVQSVAEIFILAIIVGIMLGLRVDDSEQNNNWSLSVLIAFASGVWLLVSLPWFFIEKRRPGAGYEWAEYCCRSAEAALGCDAQIWKLKQSCFILLIGYFLVGDSLNTTVTVIATLQNNIVAYNTLQLIYLLIVGIGAQAIGVYFFWQMQVKFSLSPKTVFNAIALSIILYSQIPISEVTPRGHEFLFSGLFSIIGKTSSFIGPVVSSAIIDKDPGHNSSTPFYFFLFALSFVAAGVWGVWLDLGKNKG